jgi:membrane protease YdiL (CAAX protease family)
MSIDAPTGHGTGPSPAAPFGSGPAAPAGPFPTAVDLDRWLVIRRNDGATPAEIATQLVRSGWSADAAAAVALRSLRRADRRPLLWFSLCWAAGLAAVGLTTSLHQLLGEVPDRPLAALALTVSLVMAPIAAGCAVLARRVVEQSDLAVWSPDRRAWFGTLAACTAVVGLVRLIAYLYAVVASLVAATEQPLYGRDLAQVGVSLAVALPLFWWSFTEWRRSNVAISGLREDRAAGAGQSRTAGAPTQ